MSICLAHLAVYVVMAGLPAADSPRVPQALVWDHEGKLLVATREARSVLRVNVSDGKVLAEWPVGVALASLAIDSETGRLLGGSTDGELVVIERGGSVRSRYKLGQGPGRVVPMGDGKGVWTSRWERAAIVIDLATGREIERHALGFNPGTSLKVGPDAVVIADAFGGHLAVVRVHQAERDRTVKFDGFALRALALADEGQTLLIGHAKAFGTMPITKSNVDWGLVLSSKLSGIRVADLLTSDGKTSPPMHRIALDGSRNGAADPVAVATTPDGKYILIAASGAHHLLIQDRDEGGPGPDDGLPKLGNASMTRVVETGENPVAIAVTADGKLAVTANAMGDTLTVLDIAGASRVKTIRIGPGARVGGARLRGEALFHDGGRSLDRWMSCATCHVEGHTVGIRFDTLGDGEHGDPKDTPSLLGVGQSAPYSWTGRFPRLEEQIFQSFDSSMQGATPSTDELADLIAYLRSLKPPTASKRSIDQRLIEQGRAVFGKRECTNCHLPPAYAGTGVNDVGFVDENGRSAFNPPSLRGVGFTAPYFHDGRASDLESVIRTHSPASEAPLTDADTRALLSFLQSL